MERLERELESQSIERDKVTSNLQGKKALDEYAALANKLASYQEERKRLEDLRDIEQKINAEINRLKEVFAQEDITADEYLQITPLQEADRYFRNATKQLYPELVSGISIKNNTRLNQVRYDLEVKIVGDDSDGIGAARILCFDWYILNRGRHHSVEFLWHDNRLFSNINESQRARWFSEVMRQVVVNKKQYIATINTENFNTMKPYLQEGERMELESSIRLRLHGETAENKLLGIQLSE